MPLRERNDLIPRVVPIDAGANDERRPLAAVEPFGNRPVAQCDDDRAVTVAAGAFDRRRVEAHPQQMTVRPLNRQRLLADRDAFVASPRNQGMRDTVAAP